MDVELWADPACAWSWAAYLWLDSVASDKDLTITIHPFSLEIRGRWRGGEVSPLLSAARAGSLRVLRVATRIEDGRTAFFAAATRPSWNAIAAGGAPSFDIEAGLRAAGLPEKLASCADDDSLDAEIEHSMRSVGALLDTDPAHQRIPVTVFGLDGSRRGLVGPLLDPVPDRAMAMRLWDAVITLASEPCFREFSQPVARHSLTFPAH